METEMGAGRRNLVVGGTISALALSVVALIATPSAVSGIFSSKFLPHAYCYLYDKQLIALHVGSDTLIWLSYLSISCTLVYLVWRTRREIPFSWMLLAFGLFIVACGFTHLMEVIVLWKPLYWLAGDVKLVTALASVITAIALPGLVPQIHAMVTSAQASEERGMQLERANRKLHSLSANVMSVQDAERRRIARELHDGVGQYLAAIKMSCEVALAQPAKADSALRDSLQLLDECTSEVRTISYLLHPPLLEEMGLGAAIPWYVRGFTERSKIAVELDMPATLDRLPAGIELVVFRVLQESLTNIHRHSGSKTGKVRLQKAKDFLMLLVEDHGTGFDINNEESSAGVGIASMRERVREVGGHISITSGLGGTVIEVKVPLHKEAEWQNVSSS